MLARLRRWSELVAFSHTIFALPFAASAVVLALAQPHEALTAARVLAMLGCMVTARTSAMAFNRFADRDVDAKNPRTKTRPVPSGKVSPREALLLTVVSGALFCLLAATLGFWPMVLAPPVLLVLLGYSLAKRFTWAAHAWLGLALALAPGGAWLATGAAPNLGIVLLMVAVITWLFGFDVLYALQDEAFDRAEGLRSVPARFGAKNAMRMAAVAHVVTVACLAGVAYRLERGPIFLGGVALVAAILVVEHRLVRGKDGNADLTKIPKAFFDCNAYVSMGFFAATLADALVFRR
ncbi:MAG: putative 4-hydroxybenzoate polyprenyltransferase [Labilithrix sp.]|nr:putative 4-hydroxybenzoate polyprenyltransferase [Labilithrix sp.]MCW5816004.1 putative 4-hydroxybenzoate polyprenyltransferase [Labilithrix sp.]